jgi:hypothetical protein
MTVLAEPALATDRNTAGHVVAFGPELPDWGSWQWVGADLMRELSTSFRTRSFRGPALPDCDVLVLVKHPLPPDLLARLPPRTALLSCPLDFYSSAAEIDADSALLRRCSRVLVHCERLRRYFEPYATVEYLDHHVKYAAPLRQEFKRDGYLLWVGVRTNLPPLVEWVNAHPLPGELRVLTNPERPGTRLSPEDFGFCRGLAVRVEEWTPARHLEWTAGCRAALDIKGDDFRARHKPPTKAIDFIASGVPVALSPGSSPVEHLARLGFEAAPPEDIGRWLSRAYWEDTRRLGAALRELLSAERVGRRLAHIIAEVLAERRRA